MITYHHRERVNYLKPNKDRMGNETYEIWRKKSNKEREGDMKISITVHDLKKIYKWYNFITDRIPKTTFG